MTRAEVDALVVAVLAAGMVLSVQTTRDDRRLADGAEGPAGWDAAYERFSTAVDALREVALEAVTT